MTVFVLGAGAIGSLYAAKLAARHDVTVLARPDHAERIARDGLRVVGVEAWTARVRAVTAVRAIPPGAVALLTTKVNDNESTIAAIEDVGAGTTIVCVQNGLGGEDIVRRVLDSRGPSERATVLRAVTQFGAIFQEPGVVDFKVAGFTLVESREPGAAIAAMLTESGLEGRLSDDIQKDVWRKLIFNCVINPITSITGGHVGSIADPGLDPLKQLVIDECLAVAAAAGVTFDVDFLAALTTVFGPSRNIASMRQDLLRGKTTEIDFMNGAVVDLGRRHGIDCPVNAALVSIIKTLERRKIASL